MTAPTYHLPHVGENVQAYSAHGSRQHGTGEGNLVWTEGCPARCIDGVARRARLVYLEYTLTLHYHCNAATTGSAAQVRPII